MSPLEESNTLIIDHAQKYTAPFEITQFDRNLTYILACLKAVNFRQIAFIGRELDNIQLDQAYRILWHEIPAQSENTFKRLKKLCETGWVLPWRSWSPDKILTTTSARAQAKRSDVFYILGREGRKWIKANLGLTPIPYVVEELYLSAIPLARWLTSSSCALTLDLEGAKLLSPGKAWNDIYPNQRPPMRPDFIVLHKQPTAFYICDSPFALKSDYIVSQVCQGLNYMDIKTRSVILTHTKDSFDNMFISIKKYSMDQSINRVYLGELENFKNAHGHCTVFNAQNKLEPL